MGSLEDACDGTLGFDTLAAGIDLKITEFCPLTGSYHYVTVHCSPRHQTKELNHTKDIMTTAGERNAFQANLRGSINHKSPPFPCNVLAYSKDANINGYKIIRFSTQESFDKFRVMTVAMVCVVLVEEDLDRVPESKLRLIYNQHAAKGEELDSTEIPRNELQGLVFGVIHNPDAATPYEETKMGTATPPETGTAPTTAAEATTKAAAKAAEALAKKQAKEKEKADKKAEAAAKRSDGVIGTIRQALDTETGTTAAEVLDKLVKKFPDRTRDGMSSTVKIQFSRLEKSTGRDIINAKIVGRGRVYKFADKGAVPGVVEVDAPAPAPAAPPAAEAPAPVTAPALVPSTPAPTAAAAPAKKAAGKK